MSRLRTAIRLVIALVVVVGGGAIVAYQLGIIAEPSVTVQQQANWVTEPTPGVEAQYTVRNPNPFGLPNETVFVQYHVRFNRVTIAESPRHAVRAPQGNTSRTVRAEFRENQIPLWWVSHVERDEASVRHVNVNVSGQVGPANASFPAVKSNKTFRTDVTGMVASSLEESERRYPIVAGRDGEDDPAIVIEDTAVEWGNGSIQSTPLRITATVSNPSAAPQQAPGLFGQLTMNGVEMGRWNETASDAEGTPEGGVIAPGESTTLTYVVDIDPAQSEFWFEKLATGADRVEYTVDLGYAIRSQGNLRARPGPVGIRCTGDQQTNALGEDPSQSLNFEGCEQRPIPDREDNEFVGPPGDIEVSTDSLTFTDAQVGETSTREVTVTNVGEGPLRVRTTEVVSQSPGYGVETNESFTLAPGERRTITVTFTPESEDAASALLHVVSDDPDQPETTVWLSNTGVEASVDLERTDETTQLNASIRNASPGTTVGLNVPEDDRGAENETIQIEEVSVTPDRGGEFSLNVTSSDEPLENAPDFRLNGTEGLQYMNVEHSIDNSEIDSANFTFRISKEKINESQRGSEPDDVAMYRNVNGSWESVPTTVVRETDDYYVFRANSNGFSEWTAGTLRPDMSIANARIDVEGEVVQPEDFVRIRVRIQNAGKSDGVYTTRLLFEGRQVDSRQRTVPANGTIQVVFNKSFEREGTYVVEVNDVNVDRVKVQPSGITGPGGTTIPVPVAAGAGVVLLFVVGGWVVLRRRGGDDGDAADGDGQADAPAPPDVDVTEEKPDFDDADGEEIDAGDDTGDDGDGTADDSAAGGDESVDADSATDSDESVDADSDSATADDSDSEDE